MFILELEFYPHSLTTHSQFSMRTRSISLISCLCLLLLLMKWRDISVTVTDQATSSAIVCQCPRERQRQVPRRGEDRTGDLQRGLIPPDGSYVGPSSCNLETELLGSGQRVLSYSYYTPGTELLPDYLMDIGEQIR